MSPISSLPYHFRDYSVTFDYFPMCENVHLNDIITCWSRHPIEDQFDPYGPYITYPCFSCKLPRPRTRLIVHCFPSNFNFNENHSFLCSSCISHIRLISNAKDTFESKQIFFCDDCFSNYFEIINSQPKLHSFEGLSVIKRFPPSNKTKSAYKIQ